MDTFNTPNMYIFDFDGTIMNTSAVILATIKTTIAEMGLPARTDEECRSIIGIRTDEAGKYLFPEIEISNEEFARTFRAIYARLRKDANEQAYPEVIETLTALRERGEKLAIASSRREDSLREYLRGLGIEDWFEMVVGAESVTHGKPEPEPVLLILKKLQVSPRTTLVVGDADVDIEMGKRAGCLTCAVTYGNGTEKVLRGARPNFITNRFSELLNINPGI